LAKDSAAVAAVLVVVQADLAAEALVAQVEAVRVDVVLALLLLRVPEVELAAALEAAVAVRLAMHAGVAAARLGPRKKTLEAVAALHRVLEVRAITPSVAGRSSVTRSAAKRF